MQWEGLLGWHLYELERQEMYAVESVLLSRESRVFVWSRLGRHGSLGLLKVAIVLGVFWPSSFWLHWLFIVIRWVVVVPHNNVPSCFNIEGTNLATRFEDHHIPPSHSFSCWNCSSMGPPSPHKCFFFKILETLCIYLILHAQGLPEKIVLPRRPHGIKLF
jgi:hypothetical protein